MEGVTLFSISLVVVQISHILAQVEFCDMYPPSVAKCFQDAQYHPVNHIQAHTACIREFYVDLEPDLNITKSDRAFFDLRVQHKFGMVPPPTGFRIRREYRRLSKEERIRLHSAFNVLYKNGILQKFGRLHATATRTIHQGAAFLAWHRLFIADLEEELRRVDPTVALAYWDHTMDANMTLPSESVLWTACFFGNGNGTIHNGPFRGWYGGRSGPIQRDYARDECENGRLMTKGDILNILSKCHLHDISVPPGESECVLESLHDGVHTWVGGDMGDLGFSAFDPIFWFHHAFIDYVWELFRRNQVMRCGIDPETDYPIDKYSGINDGHRAFDRMFGYEHMKNIDGLSHIFIKKFYKYETLPQCPDCGSPYLYCDIHKQLCISKNKKACDIPVGRNTYTGQGFENVNIGFTGAVSQGFHAFPVVQPFGKGLSNDPRHRDMTLAEARHAMGEVPFLPFSPLMPIFPPIGSFGAFPGIGPGLTSFDPLFSPLSWPYEPITPLKGGIKKLHSRKSHRKPSGIAQYRAGLLRKQGKYDRRKAIAKKSLASSLAKKLQDRKDRVRAIRRKLGPAPVMPHPPPQAFPAAPMFMGAPFKHRSLYRGKSRPPGPFAFPRQIRKGPIKGYYR